MDKKWLAKLAGDIEAKYGKETRDKLFGDIDSIGADHGSISAWFDTFTIGMDELGDKEFLRQMMMSRCPCGGDHEQNGRAMKRFYDSSKTFILY